MLSYAVEWHVPLFDFEDRNHTGGLVRTERQIMSQTDNSYVVKLFYSFQSKAHLYLLMEYCPGGDCFSLLRNVGCLSAADARHYLADIVLALEYLHGQGILHRDLKPDNLLIAQNGHLKLTDFGLSHVGLWSHGDRNTDVAAGLNMDHAAPTPTDSASLGTAADGVRRLWSCVGTPDYLAPEVLREQGYGPPADWWSCGIIFYELLTGAPPFAGDTREEVYHRILNDDIQWDALPADLNIPDVALDLLKQLLHKDPALRPTAAAVKAHPYFVADVGPLGDGSPPTAIDWTTHIKTDGLFVPQLESQTDTSYFDPRHEFYPVVAADTLADMHAPAMPTPAALTLPMTPHAVSTDALSGLPVGVTPAAAAAAAAAAVAAPSVTFPTDGLVTPKQDTSSLLSFSEEWGPATPAIIARISSNDSSAASVSAVVSPADATTTTTTTTSHLHLTVSPSSSATGHHQNMTTVFLSPNISNAGAWSGSASAASFSSGSAFSMYVWEGDFFCLCLCFVAYARRCLIHAPDELCVCVCVCVCV